MLSRGSFEGINAGIIGSLLSLTVSLGGIYEIAIRQLAVTGDLLWFTWIILTGFILVKGLAQYAYLKARNVPGHIVFLVIYVYVWPDTNSDEKYRVENDLVYSNMYIAAGVVFSSILLSFWNSDLVHALALSKLINLMALNNGLDLLASLFGRKSFFLRFFSRIPEKQDGLVAMFIVVIISIASFAASFLYGIDLALLVLLPVSIIIFMWSKNDIPSYKELKVGEVTHLAIAVAVRVSCIFLTLYSIQYSVWYFWKIP